MPTVFVKPGRVYIAVSEEDLDLVEEGWEPVARFKNAAIAFRAARWYADRFEYVLEW
ncbi:hypothetical protein [Pyrobaculum neutrophilum]|nr:hypothetical protein [Pyrobaculum neutrophilum]